MSDLDDYDEWEVDDERRKRACEERGLQIVCPDDHELFVDIDSPAQRAVFDHHVMRLGTLVAYFDIWPSPSRAPDHSHVCVSLTRPLKNDHERVLLQAVLGSDPMRELLSYLRLEAGMPDATIFFEHEW